MITRIKDWNLERKILFRMVSISIIVILLYSINDAFINPNLVLLQQSFSGFVIYFLLLISIFLTKNIIIVRWLVVSTFCGSVIAGFFTLGGFFGIAPFDFANILICLIVILSGRTRIICVAIFICVMLFLFYYQIKFPEAITNGRIADSQWVDIFEVISRMALSINICLALKEEYLKEHQEVNQINQILQIKNNEIATQNEEIIISNERLEELVKNRTKRVEELNEKLFEYAMFNSHKVRAPLARILGLSFLLKMELDSIDKEDVKTIKDYFLKIDDSAQEMDTIIKELNNFLSEKESIHLNT